MRFVSDGWNVKTEEAVSHRQNNVIYVNPFTAIMSLENDSKGVKFHFLRHFLLSFLHYT